MRMWIANLSLLFAALMLLSLPTGLFGQEQPDEAVTTYTLPPPPPLQKLPAATSEAGAAAPARSAPAKSLAGLAPPPVRACISKAEYDKAMLGSGCSCTCDEYARKPVNPTCDVACGGHYACWGPQISDAELSAELKKMFAGAIAAGAPLPQLSNEERETMRSVVRATRGGEWSESRMCKD